ncbi:hypothetical protein HHI36_011662 [Cryptolaemus montrouzieri]|uniref:Uncharacterized protein n=1 Tax=Cryptolaemus montrouzieri TaxID=559131 RepID=A0ABD2MMB1_9CUCU
MDVGLIEFQRNKDVKIIYTFIHIMGNKYVIDDKKSDVPIGNSDTKTNIQTLLNKSIVGSLGPEPARCMTSQKREPTCYRTTKFSSNRHRKLQPFRET